MVAENYAAFVAGFVSWSVVVRIVVVGMVACGWECSFGREFAEEGNLG